TVTYSARFVEKISDVVRSMNVSAGSSIKNGSIDMSGGGAFTVDEIKFAESDLNVVVSVKVSNGTPVDMKASWTSQVFHEMYGDCFISGFVEGGELHGIVSIKVLDASRRKEIVSGLRGKLNNSGSASSWSLGEPSLVGQYLHETETNVTVNWSGGGFVKSENVDWDYDGLMNAASNFAQRVAECPRKTWAILSRYDIVPDWQSWARNYEPQIETRKYDNVQRYTAELLDMHMEYKANLLRINDVLATPHKYVASEHVEAVPVIVEPLLDEKHQIKRQMDLIVKDIEELDKDPTKATAQQSQPQLTPPELWRARLPVRMIAACFKEDC
ncbi:hypothetical protein BDW02DRAFT_494504, partial [Decorospora gaudefroyi]